MFSHPRYRPSLLSGHFKDLHAAPQRKSTRKAYPVPQHHCRIMTHAYEAQTL